MGNYRKLIFNEALVICAELMWNLFGVKHTKVKPDSCMVLPGLSKRGTSVQSTTTMTCLKKT